jgi:hypothetical protein
MATLKNTTVSGTGAIQIPSGTTAQRPIKADIYTTVGNTNWTVPTGVTQVEVLVVGGGGGSGGGGNSGYYGGGGGGGGVVYHPGFAVTAGNSITITVGVGGTAGTQIGDSGFRGGNGGNSAFDSLIANGGGGGGGNAQANGADGGSGGGGNLYSGTGGTSNQSSYSGATIYGNSGGTGQGNYNGNGSSGGGGGAGGVGGDHNNAGTAGRGGYGIPFRISGETVFYGGGGAGRGGTRNGEAVRGSTPANVAGAAGTGAGGGGRLATSGMAGGSGIVIVRYSDVGIPSEWRGFTRFNTTHSVRETFDGTNWVNSDNGLTVGLGLTEFAPAPSAKYIKQATPSATDGFYWIRPPGETISRRIYCDMNTMGGGWMLLWYNHDGPQNSGNDGMYNVINGAESEAQPYHMGGTKGRGKAYWYNVHSQYRRVDIMKTYHAYNSSNVRQTQVESSDSGLTQGAGGNGAGNLWSGISNRTVADRLDLGENVSFADVFGTGYPANSGFALVRTLNNPVALYLDNGTTPGYQHYGSSVNIMGDNSSLGFSNMIDQYGSAPHMLWWAARHWIAYSGNSAGTNAHRCQFVCWGSENLWVERAYWIREKGIL